MILIWNIALTLLLLTVVIGSGSVPGRTRASGLFRPGTPWVEPGSVDATPAEWNDLMPAVWSYFVHRKQAVIAGNVRVLWDRYPDLKYGADPMRGINAEAALVDEFRPVHPVDGNVDAEAYEKVRLIKSGPDRVTVLVHGSETYSYGEINGRLSLSGGELLLAIELERRGSNWTVVRTDRVTDAELHARRRP